MDRLRVGSILLLGLLAASVSGLAMAAPPSGGKPGGAGGYSKPAAPGGSGGYSRPGGSGRGGGYRPAPSGSGGYSKPGTPSGSGGYSRPGPYYGHGGYYKPGGTYYRPPYYGRGGYYGHGWHDHDDDDWNVGIVVNPFLFGSWYYPGPYYPYYSPYYYPPSPYYYPGAVTVPATPPVYIERGESEEPQASASWYYCADPQGYYPYVKQCKGAWQPVAPRPPEASEEGR